MPRNSDAVPVPLAAVMGMTNEERVLVGLGRVVSHLHERWALKPKVSVYQRVYFRAREISTQARGLWLRGHGCMRPAMHALAVWIGSPAVPSAMHEGAVLAAWVAVFVASQRLRERKRRSSVRAGGRRGAGAGPQATQGLMDSIAQAREPVQGSCVPQSTCVHFPLSIDGPVGVL